SRNSCCGQKPGGDPSLADIDQQHPERERLALGAQRIGGTRIAAPQSADVDAAPQPADEETADDRAQQVAEHGFDEKLGHAGKKTSANIQRTLPPPRRSIVGIGTASTSSVHADSRANASSDSACLAVSDMTSTR